MTLELKLSIKGPFCLQILLRCLFHPEGARLTLRFESEDRSIIPFQLSSRYFLNQDRICLFIFERQGRCGVVRALVPLDRAIWG